MADYETPKETSHGRICPYQGKLKYPHLPKKKKRRSMVSLLIGMLLVDLYHNSTSQTSFLLYSDIMDAVGFCITTSLLYELHNVN